ncbi:MAG: hypothetical protein ABR973_06145 [Candidatus Acidiferrales bacterium]
MNEDKKPTQLVYVVRHTNFPEEDVVILDQWEAESLLERIRNAYYIEEREIPAEEYDKRRASEIEFNASWGKGKRR